MCLIIHKEKASFKVNLTTLFNASKRNPDGLGVIWLDDMSLSRLDSSEYELLDVDRPYVAIFRKASSGSKTLEHNLQPIRVDGSRYLMMNGTIPHLGDYELSDAYKLAAFVRHSKTEEQLQRLFSTYKHCRFAVIDTEKRSVVRYNEGWVFDSGALFSNYIDFPNNI